MTGDNYMAACTAERRERVVHNVSAPVAVPSIRTTARYHERFGLPSFEDTTFVVFGYGSILWKQEFEYEAEYESYIKGYKRVFYQGTKVHRGQPGAPGRVVTLLPTEDDKEARVYGKAYQLPADPEKLNRIFTALDVREGGYDRVQLPLYNAHPTTGNLTTPTTSAPSAKAFKSEAADVYARANSTDFAAGEAEEQLDIFTHPNAPAVQPRRSVMYLVYIATKENDDYVGDAPMEVMAREILSRTGISGPNREYLFFLADCLRAIGAADPHVFELDATARRLLRGHEQEYISGAQRLVSIA
ncbi:hypothetical protein ABB37_00120 [Leptomonas pyrrhocoris]|uniref:glutathione-specific gamma-glutamylcyclotransferase n=1 Tax=Leptomonas pyrrhocoris TaxID=157538 RepID=A0A0N1J5E8_LEPPY|nr:hypothetical protein ABB37_00120 [Leptomonas pyrrhocoris]XP_015664204.1 hypothetical protein ABB37_00120 [Leptomonas pyrrhocoris]KPA85764.1 hypothetical protein ABB37_00120 [Leptomonas pyrrhocoris]KPA85765.1 hypothetical protein ABB37_00120 [Leptomonas pyrrhocoris]|eukprot:XP_015664203.1 hypothetical protein ABB37_00120 [Leptomonas pyrrhocoris]